MFSRMHQPQGAVDQICLSLALRKGRRTNRKQASPQRVGKLETLKTLELKGLRIESLPYSVKTLTALETLRCTKVKTLPPDSYELQSLKTLEVVDLDHVTGVAFWVTAQNI